MIAMADTRKPRWFSPTPGRLLAVLLAVEGFLWLSERFRWFAFNQHKGWTVLTAVAAVGVFLLVMLGWFILALLLHCRFQFSMLSLLVLAVAVALPCGWLATEMKKAKKQREVVDGIAKLHGSVDYDYQHYPSGTTKPRPAPRRLPWLWAVLGDDVFVNVTWVALSGPGVSDANLEHLIGLSNLLKLNLNATKISDAGLEHLKGLTQLQVLHLDDTNVSDAGLEYLNGLTRLQELYLGGTNVTDGGLKYLKGLTELKWLSLVRTNVTDAGVRKLRRELPKCRIFR